MIYYEPQSAYNKAIIRYEGDRAVYSLTLLIKAVKKHHNMTFQEAVEWFSYNMQNIGFEDWPIIIDDLNSEDSTEEDTDEE